MNENYLWDKTGEPDEEIQQLESLLSEFKYEPRPLKLPEETPIKRWSFVAATVGSATFRYAAIAATVLLALGLGLWIGLRQAPLNNVVIVNEKSPLESPTPNTPAKELAPQPELPAPNVNAPRPQFIKHVAPQKSKSHFAVQRRSPKMSEAEQEQAAKEKVLYALQITSKSLDLVRAKIQTDTN